VLVLALAPVPVLVLVLVLVVPLVLIGILAPAVKLVLAPERVLLVPVFQLWFSCLSSQECSFSSRPLQEYVWASFRLEDVQAERGFPWNYA
jgi:hypothetical protein